MDPHIIIIDDEIDFLDSVKRGLRIAGFKNLHLEDDPQKALARFEKGESFDIALMDISMPGMSGTELLEHIQIQSPNTVCVMISAVGDADFIMRCAKNGAYDYLVKPISQEILIQSINRALGFKTQVMQQKKTEQALKDSEELNRMVLENISDAVFITDPSGKFSYISPNVDFIFRFSQKEVTEFGNIKSLLGNKIIDNFRSTFLTEMKNVECAIQDKEGETHNLLVNIKQISIKYDTLLFTCRDVSDREKMMTVLKGIEKIFKQLTDNITEVFWVTSAGYKEMEYVSPAFEIIWGYSCEDLYKTPGLWFDAIHPDDKERVAFAIGNVHKSQLEVQYRICRPDHTIRWIRDIGFLLKNDEGEIYKIVGMAQDITNMKVYD